MSLVMILDGIWIICNLPVICGKLRNYWQWQLWQLIFYFTQPTKRTSDWPIATQHFSHVPPSFSYRIEQCSNSSKFLIREKTCTRNDDRRPSFLDQVSCTSFSYEKLGSSVRGLKVKENTVQLATCRSFGAVLWSGLGRSWWFDKWPGRHGNACILAAVY